MKNQSWLVGALVALLIGAVGGFMLGKQNGYQTGYAQGNNEGYAKAEADIKRLQEEAGARAAAEAASEANPFSTENPLKALGNNNPFSKVSELLNPFK